MTKQQHDERGESRRGVARDEQADMTEQERILQDNIIGQKTTPEGTAGKDGDSVPTGDVAREKTERS